MTAARTAGSLEEWFVPREEWPSAAPLDTPESVRILFLSGDAPAMETMARSGTALEDFRDGVCEGKGLPVMSIEGPAVSGETTGLMVFSLRLPREVSESTDEWTASK